MEAAAARLDVADHALFAGRGAEEAGVAIERGQAIAAGTLERRGGGGRRRDERSVALGRVERRERPRGW